MKSFNTDRNGKGTKEWSDRSYNICDGCEHGCLYCYAKSMRGRFDKSVHTPGVWERQLLKEATSLGKNVCQKQVVMFPTAHDLTPRFVRKSLRTIENLLADENQVLIVTKPHFSVVKALCRQLRSQKQSVLFRFTIGSLDKKLCAFWEPQAPPPAERVRALRYAFNRGFRTSVSIEPMLGSVDETIQLVRRLDPFVTDTLWIGKMQRIPFKRNKHIPGFLDARNLIREQQEDSEILRMVRLLRKHPKVRWKDSVKEVISEHLGDN